MLYLPFDSDDLFLFGRDNEGKFQFWTRYTELTQNIDSLAVSEEQVYLSKIHPVDIYQGTFPFPGMLFVYFGYRLKDGTIVYNGQQYMTVRITNANTTVPE
jgi:nicotinic acid mononucleotide adenylyltransferase